MVCFMRSLIRQLYHFAADFNRVLLQRVGALHCEHCLNRENISLRYLTFMIETFEHLMKSCAKFDMLFVNIQCATEC